MSYTMYTPLNVWLDPASVTDVVAYIQNYLSENEIYSETEIETIIHDYLIAHPELIGGVQSVNGKTGTVVLSASDINTANNVTIESVLSSLSSQISDISASVSTNTNNITGLTGRMTTAETDISNLKSNFDEIIITLKTQNIYDYHECTDGYYIPYDSQTGNPVALSNFCYSGYVNINGLSKFTFGRNENYQSIGQVHTVFYDKNKTYLPGVGVLATDSTIPVSVPANAEYMRFSMEIAKKASYAVYEGSSVGEFCAYYQTTIPASKNELDVYMPSNTENLRYWLVGMGQIADDNRQINLHIPNGTYNTLALFSASERSDASFVGLTVPDNVFLIGQYKNNTVLTASFDSANSIVSTLNFNNTSGILNLTVEGTNTRYAIHDDLARANNKNYYRIVENCIIKATTPAMGQAYGSGSKSGAIWRFSNTVFEGGFSWHSNINFSVPNEITLENCIVNSISHQGVVLKSLASGVINKVHFIGCEIGMITCTEETIGIGLDFEIDGFGNNDIPINFTNTGTHPIPFFSDKMVSLKCFASQLGGSTIQICDPVLKYGIFSAQFGSTRNPKRYGGLALEVTPDGSYGKVLRHGYYLASDLGVTFANGSLLTIKNGALAIGTDGTDYIIGSVERMWSTDFVYLF